MVAETVCMMVEMRAGLLVHSMVVRKVVMLVGS